MVKNDHAKMLMLTNAGVAYYFGFTKIETCNTIIILVNIETAINPGMHTMRRTTVLFLLASHVVC